MFCVIGGTSAAKNRNGNVVEFVVDSRGNGMLTMDGLR